MKVKSFFIVKYHANKFIGLELKLSEKVYKCDECGSQIDRDLNASINIREVGRNLLAY